MSVSVCLRLPSSATLILKRQGAVVQTMDSAVRRINHYPVDTSCETDCAIQWIVIYPVDSAIHLLNNWGQYGVNYIHCNSATIILPCKINVKRERKQKCFSDKNKGARFFIGLANAEANNVICYFALTSFEMQ